MDTGILVLASTSPRRADVLRQLGVPFRAARVAVDETPPVDAPPHAVPLALARRKVAAAAERHGDAWVLAADTLGVLDGAVLGKPADAEDALRLLLRLSGRTHDVVTGVAVRAPDGTVHGDAVTTRVTFARVTERQARAYVATGEPLGKAGAYAIQGAGAGLVTGVEGDSLNVVGLPGRRTVELLHDAGFALPAHLLPR